MMYIFDEFTTAEELYETLSLSTDDYIYLCDMKKNRYYFPPGMVDEFNLPGQVLDDAAALWGQMIHENERDSFFEDLQSMLDGKTNVHCQEYRALNRHGEWVWLRCRGFLQRDLDGTPALFAGIITNIERKGKIDPISGLLNKFEFEYQLDGESRIGGVMLLGMDNFKSINNLYGHDFGDEVLRITAKRLQEILPKHFRIYRLDGDCYALLDQDGSEENWKQIYRDIYEEFQAQKTLRGQKYYCTFSAGCAIKEEGLPNSELFKQAEFALEAAKKNGRNQLCMFEPELMLKRLRSLALAQIIREDVEQGCINFEVYYQPQVRADTRKLIGAEALLRWHCDMFGSISPVEFIPILEKTGMIHEVGEWVLEQAVKTCQKWRQVASDFVMSINISYLQLLRKDFLTNLSDIFVATNLPTEAIHIELTESCMATDSRPLREAFAQIRSLGLQIAMDDFGTGYSSLAVLKSSPADVVKIDRAFVRDILVSQFDEIFIKFAVAVCHSANILVCLEGVETELEYRAVSNMGLDIIQGFLFGKPQSKENFEKLFLHL